MKNLIFLMLTAPSLLLSAQTYANEHSNHNLFETTTSSSSTNTETALELPSEADLERYLGPIRSLEQHLEGTMLDSGTSIGGTDIQDTLVSYFSNTRDILRRYKGYASNAMRRSRYDRALNKLTVGLVEALRANDNSEVPGTFTRKSIIRGIRLINTFRLGFEEQTPKYKETIINFVELYYNFILNDVMPNFDQTIYLDLISTISTCGRCEGEVARLEGKYVEYAKAQLDLLIDQLTLSRRVQGYRVYYTRGNDRTFLKMAHIITAETALDLNSSLWQAHFAREISDLRLTSDNLENFIRSGERDIWEDEVFAVNETVRDVNIVRSRLNQYLQVSRLPVVQE